MSQIYHSPFPPVDIPTNLSISQLLQKYNPDDVHPDTTIYDDFDGYSEALSYGGLRSKAAKCAHGLRTKLDLNEGDTVCIYAKNSVNWVLLAHSINWFGGIFSAVNPVATSYELVHYFKIAEPKVIAVDAGGLKAVETALEGLNLPTPPSILLIDDGDSKGTLKHRLKFPADILDLEAPLLPAYDLSNRNNREVVAAMCFSSGTSGRPKGVLLSHYCLLGYCLSLRATSPLVYGSTAREVFFPSFAHIYGICVGFLIPAFAGSYLVAMRTFDFIPYLGKAADIRSTVLRLVPATAIRMAKDPEARKLDLSSVNVAMCAGASLATEVATELQRMMNGTFILNGYGMSEGTISLMREAWSELKAGSVGKPAAGVTIRVVDDDLNDVPVGVDGQVLFKGPTLFMRYKDNAAETEASFHDGWFCTGDVVQVDEDGFFWITGRKKELIKFRGHQVPPAELEDVLLSHHLVNDAGVCGVYDSGMATEVPVGYVSLSGTVKSSDQERVLKEISDFVTARVAPHKRLRGGLFRLDEMPRNSNAKLMRLDLPAKKEELRRSKL